MQTAVRLSKLRESLIREMTRMAIENQAINLSQGFPDFDAPNEVRQAAVEAILAGSNQYTPSWGIDPLRQALARQYSHQLGWQVDPALHVTVTCGVTEAINAAMMAILNPGDQVIIIEPAHENFWPSAIFAGAEPVGVTLDGPDYRLDPDKLNRSITGRTKALLLNTPHNPTGRVFDDDELAAIAALVTENDLVLITDEIYDRILYDGHQHQSPGGMPGLQDRTITIGGLGKTFSITGWRLGYVVAPEALSKGVRTVHEYLTICAPSPLQAGAVTALSLSQDYYDQMRADYHQRRDVMMAALTEVGFSAPSPEGAYYILADFSGLPIPQAKWDSLRFASWMVEEIGVAVVPGTVFYSGAGLGQGSVRFAFPKKFETLQAAAERLLAMRP